MQFPLYGFELNINKTKLCSWSIHHIRHTQSNAVNTLYLHLPSSAEGWSAEGWSADGWSAERSLTIFCCSEPYNDVTNNVTLQKTVKCQHYPHFLNTLICLQYFFNQFVRGQNIDTMDCGQQRKYNYFCKLLMSQWLHLPCAIFCKQVDFPEQVFPRTQALRLKEGNDWTGGGWTMFLSRVITCSKRVLFGAAISKFCVPDNVHSPTMFLKNINRFYRLES